MAHAVEESPMDARPDPSSVSLLRELVAAAILAPSSHNTQPWRFRLAAHRIDLWADRTRALPVNDPDDRELLISCGAALFNLRVAAAHHGLAAGVALLPDAAHPDLLARLQCAPTAHPGAEGALFDAIARRHTVRTPFRDEAPPPAALAALREAAAAEGARLDVLDDATRRHAAALLVAEGDTLQWGNPAWRRELAAWMHPRSAGDGLAVPALAAPVARAVVGALDLGDPTAARDRSLVEHSPVLAVIGTPGEGPLDWLRAGQALQRVLLVAVGFGLQASYFNQPVEVASLCRRLARMLGHPGCPQMMLRFGVPVHDAPPAPRRPLDEVIDED
jgi:nitroreductase